MDRKEQIINNMIAKWELYDEYGADRLVLLVRDPYWIFAYWEITPEKNQNAWFSIPEPERHNARKVLRVYDVTGIDFNGFNANSSFDIELNDWANNWYINVPASGCSYCADIGIRKGDGHFLLMLRSNFVSTPPDTISGAGEFEMMTEEELARLYLKKGTKTNGKSVAQLVKEHLEIAMFSGTVRTWNR